MYDSLKAMLKQLGTSPTCDCSFGLKECAFGFFFYFPWSTTYEQYYRCRKFRR